MLTDGLTLTPGSTLGNPVIASGTTFPTHPTPGELFFRTDLKLLHIFADGGWTGVGIEGYNAANFTAQTNTIRAQIDALTADTTILTTALETETAAIREEIAAIADNGASGGGTSLQSTSSFFPGAIAPMTGNIRWYPGKAVTLRSVFMTISTPPTTAVTIEVLRNGATIAGTMPTIAVGAYTSTMMPLDIAMAATDYLTVNILAGNGENLQVRFEYEAAAGTPTPEPTPPAVPTDPFWANTTAALPLSANMTDAKGGNVVTTAGNAALSADKAMFGTQSLKLDGDGDYIALPQTVTNFGTGDFTIEAWLNPAQYINVASSNSSIWMSQFAGNGARWTASVNATASYFTFQPDNNSNVSATGPVAPLNAWTHVAVVRQGGQVRVYVNGVAGSATAIANDLTVASPVGIGRFINASTPYLEQYKGYIQEVRITRAARYTANFTPPTAPMPLA